MNLAMVALWTGLGSAIWNAILITLGMYLGESWETVSHYVDTYSTVVYVLLILIMLGFLAYFIRRSMKEKAAGTEGTTK